MSFEDLAPLPEDAKQPDGPTKTKRAAREILAHETVQVPALGVVVSDPGGPEDFDSQGGDPAGVALAARESQSRAA